MTTPLIYPDKDSLLRLMLRGGEVRVLMARTTRMAQEAADIHQASDTAAAAMGRVLPVCAMMGGLIKEEEGRLTVSIAGNGAGGRITCGVQHNRLKIAVANPQAELPKTPDGRPDVAGFIGREGQIVVVKDFKGGEPFSSIAHLVSGELGEDFAHYFTVSEQVPSLVSLGCLNQDGVVLSSGGILIQAMPGCSDSTITDLENRIPFYANISREIYDRGLMQLASAWFSDFEPEFLGEEPLLLRCDCSRDKMRRALAALGREDLQEMADQEEPVEITCHFCRKERSFPREEIRALLEENQP
ncbi:MAG: Hsp33 family molecular chaperone HslO [Clostridiales bacterium]|nr:Hsp33 family molecular chaperone HslO [Clostridiales bacterium]